MIIIDSNVVKKSIEHYGANLQTVVCMEESAELIQAISKMKRGKDNRDNLIEEMADVMICIEILKQVYGISDNEIVIPDLVLYLNPKSFNLSKKIDVSVVLYLLNI